MLRLHHVAIAVAEFDKYVELFLNLGMQIQRTTGEAPNRQIWFAEGIQLKEQLGSETGDCVDHIALGTGDKAAVISTALQNDCSLIKDGKKWFALPNGIAMELMDD